MKAAEEFYVGYLPAAPPALAKRIARVAAGTVLGCLAVAAVLVFDQPQFAASRFEYGVVRDFAGSIETWPYPMLVANGSRYLLVATGKHGLSGASAFEGRPVRLKGSLIERGADRMIEVVQGSLTETGAPGAESTSVIDLGPVKLRGEIVDSKCYFGVMNPGERKVHRDCAARCISGGIPPAFIARDEAGTVRTLLLTGPEGEALNRAVLPYVAEPLELSGELVRKGQTLILRVRGL